MKFKTLKLIPVMLLLFVTSIAMSQEHRIEVENYELSKGLKVQKANEEGEDNKIVGFIRDGASILIKNYTFKKAFKNISIRASSPKGGAKILVCVGKKNSKPVATIDISKTGGWKKWKTFSAKKVKSKKLKKTKDIYLKFVGQNKFLCNINYIEFK